MFIGGPDGPTPVGCVILVIAVTKASNWVIRLSTSTDQLGVANLISFLDTNTNSSDLALKINLSEPIWQGTATGDPFVALMINKLN